MISHGDAGTPRHRAIDGDTRSHAHVDNDNGGECNKELRGAAEDNGVGPMAGAGPQASEGGTRPRPPMHHAAPPVTPCSQSEWVRPEGVIARRLAVEPSKRRGMSEVGRPDSVQDAGYRKLAASRCLPALMASEGRVVQPSSPILATTYRLRGSGARRHPREYGTGAPTHPGTRCPR
ncbi:hypothetical protein E2C01_044980 [Portunus trituberculatus]|uniref:Uncharacterized protein n=1 Tax=Portunus trituberculatus TaxID=210409 RepID=A0A5B7FTI5_PORTR|nr:hypothetical protein [Portunus trituberculatus]